MVVRAARVATRGVPNTSPATRLPGLLLAAIRQPDFQEPDPHPGRERYWLRTQPPFRLRWLRVVVQFEGGVDHVVTAFGQDNEPEGLQT